MNNRSEHASHDGGMMMKKMSEPHMQQMQQMYMDHLQTLWTQFGVIALGAWLLASPMMLGYLDPGSFGPQVFWHGGAIEGAGRDPSPPLEPGNWYAVRLRQQAQALPKALVVSAALGVWLMFTRATLDSSGMLADSDHLTGALVFTFSIAAFAEVARPLRAINFLFGIWLVAAPWLLDGGNRIATVADLIAGALLILLAIPRGSIRHQYGGWDRYLAW